MSTDSRATETLQPLVSERQSPAYSRLLAEGLLVRHGIPSNDLWKVTGEPMLVGETTDRVAEDFRPEAS